MPPPDLKSILKTKRLQEFQNKQKPNLQESPPDSAHTVPDNKIKPLVNFNHKRLQKLRNRKIAVEQRSDDGEGPIIAVKDFEKMSNLNISEIQPPESNYQIEVKLPMEKT